MPAEVDVIYICFYEHGSTNAYSFHCTLQVHTQHHFLYYHLPARGITQGPGICARNDSIILLFHRNGVIRGSTIPCFMINGMILVIPVLLLVVGIEWLVSYKHNRRIYTGKNFAMNLAIGAIDQVASLFYFAALYFTLEFVCDHFRWITLTDEWYVWVLAYVVIDFLSYWYHRFSHRVNVLWAGHVTHHSSEHFNFSNGFRTSFFQGINRILFWSILPVFGFSPVMLVIILKVSGLYDFLLHTQYVPKLGVLEKILVTPSHHRVHHGRNEIYIDKNYSSTFIIWDKLFGTFQEETEPVEYGIKGNYLDEKPSGAIGYYYMLMWRTMKMQCGIQQKIRILFLSPDRTPACLGDESNTCPQVPTYRARAYAWFLLACNVPGMIMLLLYKDFLPASHFLLFLLVGITGIGTGAMILNGSVRSHFSLQETMRLGIALAVTAGIAHGQWKAYLVAVFVFLLLSAVLFLWLPQSSGRNADKASRHDR